MSGLIVSIKKNMRCESINMSFPAMVMFGTVFGFMVVFQKDKWHRAGS